MILRRVVTPLVVLLLAGAMGYAVRVYTNAQSAQSLPTAPVRKGDFLVTLRCRGELKARVTEQVSAPLNVPDLRIVWQAAPGSPVKQGDPVVRFDPSSARQQLEEMEAVLRQAEASLQQAEAESRMQLEQDRIDLADTVHLVERAKIEVSKSEIESRLKGEESRVDLGIAEQKQAVQRAKLRLNEASNQAKVAGLKRQRDKAASDVERNKRRLERMELKAPITGVVNFLQNFSQGWMNAKPFKVGDQVWPGSVLAEIPDLASMEMEGKIEEIDRGQMNLEQQVLVRIDSLPEAVFQARMMMLSPLTEMGWEWPPSRSFRGFAKIQNPDPRLRPGMNGRMDVVLRRIPNALSVPAKAIFTRNGKPVVYARERGAYVAMEVEVDARNPDETAIRGPKEGTLVALVEPEKER